MGTITPFRGPESHNDLMAPTASKDAAAGFTVCVLALGMVLSGIAFYEIVRWLIGLLS